MVNNLPANAGGKGMQVPSMEWEDLLERGMATHYSILAWKMPWKEEPGRLQPTGSKRAGHDWACKHIHFFKHNAHLLKDNVNGTFKYTDFFYVHKQIYVIHFIFLYIYFFY